MKKRNSFLGIFIPAALVAVVSVGIPVTHAAELSGTEMLEAAADSDKHTYLLFYRGNDQRTYQMERTVKRHVGDHEDQAQFAKIHVYDRNESEVVNKFDAKRLPTPTVICIAPNGAVTGIHNRSVSGSALERSVVTPKYAELVLALQNEKVAVVSLLPTAEEKPLKAARMFLKSEDFSDRTEHIQICADDTSEKDFFDRVKVDMDIQEAKVILFAPPGRHLGTFSSDITLEKLTKTVHESGSCNCEKCKHKHSR